MLKVILNKNLKECNQGKAEYAEEVAWLAILFLQTMAPCCSWGDLTPFPGKQHLLQASGCCGAEEGQF